MRSRGGNKYKSAFGIYILLAIVSVVGTSSCRKSSFSEDSRPIDFSVTPKYLNLGEITEGRTIWAKFSVINLSESPIHLTGIKSTCGCTSAKMESKVIPAGGTAILKVEMSNNGRIGKFGAQVTVEFSSESSSDKATEFVLVEAKAIQIATVNPSVIDLGVVPATSNVIATELKIREGNKPAGWNEIIARSDSSNIWTDGIVGSANTLPNSLYVRFSPAGLPQGQFRGSMEFTFLDQSGSVVMQKLVPVRAFVSGPIEIRPSSLYLGVVKSDAVVHGEILIRSDDGQSLKVVGINPGKLSDNLEFRFSQNVATETKVTYSFSALELEGNVSEVIQITVRLETDEITIKVPLIGFVR